MKTCLIIKKKGAYRIITNLTSHYELSLFLRDSLIELALDHAKKQHIKDDVIINYTLKEILKNFNLKNVDPNALKKASNLLKNETQDYPFRGFVSFPAIDIRYEYDKICLNEDLQVILDFIDYFPKDVELALIKEQRKEVNVLFTKQNYHAGTPLDILLPIATDCYKYLMLNEVGHNLETGNELRQRLTLRYLEPFFELEDQLNEIITIYA